MGSAKLWSLFDDNTRLSILLGHLGACVIGALLTLAFAPFTVYPLAVLCPAALFYLICHLTPRVAFVRCWIFGLGFLGTGISWIYVSVHVYGETPVILAIFLTALLVMALSLFFATFGYVHQRIFKRHILNQSHQHIAFIFGFSSLWVIWEWLRSWVFTGFPWLFLGTSFIDSPLAGWVPIIGVYGVSWLSVYTGMSLLVFKRSGYGLKIGLLISVVIIWLGGYGLKQITWTQPLGEPSRVSLVQGNIPQEIKWLQTAATTIIDIYVNMSAPLWTDSDLIIWPESAIVAPLPQSQFVVDQLADLAEQTNTTLITGIPEQTADGRYYNALIAVGLGSGHYLKYHLVPFGEYLPLENQLRGLINAFDLPMSSSIPGPKQSMPLLADGTPLSAAICYEIAYPQRVVDQLHGAAAIVTVSNDTWFGHSIGPKQHFEIARMRALETGRYVLRATNNGITAVIDAKGQVSARVPAFEQTVLTTLYQPMQGQTPLLYYGHTGVILLVFALFILSLILNTRIKL